MVVARLYLQFSYKNNIEWLLSCDSFIKSRFQLRKHCDKLYENYVNEVTWYSEHHLFPKQFWYPEPLHGKVKACLADRFYNMASLGKGIRAKRSIVWEHCVLIDGTNPRTRCKHCNEEMPYSKNTSTMMSHLTRHHFSLLHQGGEQW